MFTVRYEEAEIGELALDALPPAGQLVVLAGKRWLVKEIDAAVKTVWVLPAKSGKVPTFLGNGGDLHSRVVQEMKAILLADDVPAYLDDSARQLLGSARHVAKTVGLDTSNILRASGGIRWFPWVGTRCLRTLAILCELNGISCDTDRISLWVPINGPDNFWEFLNKLVTGKCSLDQLGSRVSPRQVEKFDEFLPDELLVRACAAERLAIEEAEAAIGATLSVLRSLHN
jgi:ATP-dependent Lhr-like helicase